MTLCCLETVLKLYHFSPKVLESALSHINVVLNWFEELKERVPVP